MNLKSRIKTFTSSILLKIYYPKIIFKIIKNQGELKKVYNLVWQVYGLEKRYIDPKRFSPEIFKDKYDDQAIIIGAFDGDKVIGTVRMIFDSPFGFYAEEDFNINPLLFPSPEIVEISRLAVSKKYRKKKLISFGLLKKALELSKRKGKKRWLVVVSEKMKNHFLNSFGIKFYSVETKPLTQKEIEARKKMINYYNITNPSCYLIFLEEIY